MVEESHAYRFCSLGKSCSNDAIEFSRRGVPADMVMYCKCWGQAPKLSAGARPRDKVSFRNLLLGPGPKVKF